MCVCVSRSVVSHSLWSHGYSSPGSFVHGFSSQEYWLEWVAIPFSRGSSQPRAWTWVSCIAGRFFTVWATREAHRLYNLKVKVDQSCPTLCDPMDYTVHGILQARILEWVASCSLLQGIFPFQGANPDLPHCRRILYQLSQKGRILIFWILRETSERFWAEEWYDLNSLSRYMSILKNIQCYFGFLTVHKQHCAVYLILLFTFPT